MKFTWFTNAHQEHYGNSIAINADHVLATFSVTRTRNDAEETITVLFAGSEGAWEVQETLEEVVARLNNVN